MRKSIACLVCLLIILPFCSNNVLASHEITCFQNNKKGAVTITFDDGYPSQVIDGIPLLNIRNLKGTFFAITMPDWINNNVSWETFRDVASQGHEIGSHTVNDLDLTTLSEANIRWELSESQRMINENIPSQFCKVFAYPYGKLDAQIQSAVNDYYIAARGTWAPEGGFLNYYENGPTEEAVNFFNIGSYGVDKSTTIADLDYYLNLAEQQQAWFSVHFYEIDDASFFAQFLDHLLSKDLWVDTFGTIARYMREKLYSTLKVISEGPYEIKLYLSHPLDTAIYDLPLTIRSTVPSLWNVVKVQQGDSFSIIGSIKEGEETLIYFDAFPNQGEIVLSDGTQRFVYVANNSQYQINSNDYILLTDIDTNETKSFLYTYNKKTNPSGWANIEGMTFLGRRLFITGSIASRGKVSMIWEIDPNTGREIFSFSTPSGSSQGLASDGATIYVSQSSGFKSKIYQFTPSGKLIDSFDVNAALSGLAFGRGYLFGADRNKIYRIDPAIKQMVASFNLPLNEITGLDFIDGSNPYLLTTAFSSKNVTLIELDEDLNFNGITETLFTLPGLYGRAVSMFP